MAGKEDKEKGGLYLVSKNGGYGHASGDLGKEDLIPIPIDLLVSASGGFPGGSQGGEIPELAELLKVLKSDTKFTEKTSKTLEALKFWLETAGKGYEIKEAVNEFLEKRKQESKKSENNSDNAQRFTRKGAIYFDENIGHTIERGADSTGMLSDKNPNDTMKRHH